MHRAGKADAIADAECLDELLGRCAFRAVTDDQEVDGIGRWTELGVRANQPIDPFGLRKRSDIEQHEFAADAEFVAEWLDELAGGLPLPLGQVGIDPIDQIEAAP